MALVEEWDHIRTDTGSHRTYWVSEWPAARKHGISKDLVLAGDFAHVVTELLRPIPVDKALTIIERRKSDWGTTDKFVRSPDVSSHSATILNPLISTITNPRSSTVMHPSTVNGLITVTGSTKESLSAIAPQ